MASEEESVRRSQSEPACSVIIPTRNECGNIEPLVQWAPSLGKCTELVFVDGASTNGTVEEIQRCQREFPHRQIQLIAQVEDMGKIGAVQKGCEMATGAILVLLDADLAIVPEDLPPLFEIVATGKADFVNASRLILPRQQGSIRFLNVWGNRFFSAIAGWLTGQRITDVLSGTKIFGKRDFERMAPMFQEFEDFDRFGELTLTFAAAQTGLRMKEIPTPHYCRTYGKTKVERFKVGWKYMKVCGRALWMFRFRGRKWGADTLAPPA